VSECILIPGRQIDRQREGIHPPKRHISAAAGQPGGIHRKQLVVPFPSCVCLCQSAARWPPHTESDAKHSMHCDVTRHGDSQHTNTRRHDRRLCRSTGHKKRRTCVQCRQTDIHPLIHVCVCARIDKWNEQPHTHSQASASDTQTDKGRNRSLSFPSTMRHPGRCGSNTIQSTQHTKSRRCSFLCVCGVCMSVCRPAKGHHTQSDDQQSLCEMTKKHSTVSTPTHTGSIKQAC